MIDIARAASAALDVVVQLRADADDVATLAELDQSVDRLETLLRAALALTTSEREYVEFATTGWSAEEILTRL